MKTLNWNDPASAETLLREGAIEEILVLREGKPVALVSPVDQDDLAWLLRERDPAFIASIAQARADVLAGKGMSHQALKDTLGI